MATAAVYFIVGTIVGAIIGMIIANETAKESVRESALEIFKAGYNEGKKEAVKKIFEAIHKEGVKVATRANAQRKEQDGNCDYISCDHCTGDSGSSRSGEGTGEEK